MSLIQQALEKTNRAQETKTTNPSTPPRAYDRDPMGAVLEQELTQVQESHAKQQKIYWKVSLGVLLVCLAAGLSYFGIRSSQSSSGGIQNSSPVAKILPRAVTAMPKAPLRIFSGTIYRLTGVTNISGRTMAVINDDIVSVGDSLSGNAVVKAIGAGEVLLDVQGKEIKLTL